MGEQPKQPEWARWLDSREWSQVLHAQAYARDHLGAGAPGHGQFLLIAKLAKLLDDCETFDHEAPSLLTPAEPPKGDPTRAPDASKKPKSFA